jgi:hypothetical protein
MLSVSSFMTPLAGLYPRRAVGAAAVEVPVGAAEAPLKKLAVASKTAREQRALGAIVM